MINPNHKETEGISEIHDIMILLRGDTATNDGDFRSRHLGTVLEYLRGQKTEDKAVTLQKLTVKLGMAQRQIRENYIDGLIAWGIIAIAQDCKKWYWVGVKAIRGATGNIRENNPTDNKYVIDSLTNKHEIKEGETFTEYMERLQKESPEYYEKVNKKEGKKNE